MSSSILGGVERLREGLDYHLSRHNVLVSNLAQADTPGYKPKDLERAGFAGKLEVAMAKTNEAHLGRGAVVGPDGTPRDFKVVDDPRARASADGNGVDLDREAVKIATNQMRYDVLAQLASSALAGLAWAAGDAKGG